MSPQRKRDSRADLIFLVLLIGALLGGAWLVGRRTKETNPEDQDESIVRPRHIPPELVKFHELPAINVDAKRLRGMAVGADDRIYVLDRFKVLVYESNGTFVRDYDLDRAPHCAAFGANKNLLYLGLGRQVGVLNLETDKVTEWRDLGEQALTASIAVGEKTVMVGDSGSRAVWVFALTGEELSRISNEGAPEGEGHAPSVHFDVACAGDNTFWATDAGRHAVIHYSSTGMVLGRWGKQGEAIEDFGGCCNPVHLAVFPDGRLLIVEKKPDLVKVAFPDGTLDCVVAPPKDFIFKTFLADAAVDSKGRALVLDPKQGQVRIFVENKKE
jgi:DNA-binding beta-propeller fold protein YncE